MSRENWDTYFINIARQVATRATCPRKSVGAVIVRDRTILSTGYNGSARGLPHCTDAGCMMDEGNHCIRVVHAEINAVAQAARQGVRLEGATLYCLLSPCWPCFRTLVNAGVREMIYETFYRDDKIFEAAASLGSGLMLYQLIDGKRYHFFEGYKVGSSVITDGLKENT